MHHLLQISMNVNLTLMTVMGMLSALIPLVASDVTVTLDTQDLGESAVSSGCCDTRIFFINYCGILQLVLMVKFV